MQTIVINNQKGGVGKTMLAVHLAWFLAEDGARAVRRAGRAASATIAAVA